MQSPGELAAKAAAERGKRDADRASSSPPSSPGSSAAPASPPSSPDKLDNMQKLCAEDPPTPGAEAGKAFAAEQTRSDAIADKSDACAEEAKGKAKGKGPGLPSKGKPEGEAPSEEKVEASRAEAANGQESLVAHNGKDKAATGESQVSAEELSADQQKGKGTGTGKLATQEDAKGQGRESSVGHGGSTLEAGPSNDMSSPSQHPAEASSVPSSTSARASTSQSPTAVATAEMASANSESASTLLRSSLISSKNAHRETRRSSATRKSVTFGEAEARTFQVDKFPNAGLVSQGCPSPSGSSAAFSDSPGAPPAYSCASFFASNDTLNRVRMQWMAVTSGRLQQEAPTMTVQDMLGPSPDSSSAASTQPVTKVAKTAGALATAARAAHVMQTAAVSAKVAKSQDLVWEDRQGWLYIQSAWRWQLRFFELRRGRLRWWENDTTFRRKPQPPPMESILLHDGQVRWSVSIPKAGRIQLARGSAGKKYLFSAENPAEGKEWTIALMQHIAYIDMLLIWPLPPEGRQGAVTDYGVEVED
eukprot:gnl/TRDRNA2_/TRDRNA2_169623_c1_seq1.p1 gnl/TRDRNA2_/TRDRNA2_169623_c1~~gnl/TRDRNA2_/TRDRNA2_169623_c1_seq1.p1  ORF type:complete len:578 (+),score=123.20 gnl/TRDRNA2_/TRDRNA2_169623_c1_seq1:133-1734(+)